MRDSSDSSEGRRKGACAPIKRIYTTLFKVVGCVGCFKLKPKAKLQNQAGGMWYVVSVSVGILRGIFAVRRVG